MGNFFAQLKRRHVYRVAAAYAVVAWVLLQLVNNLAPGLNLPNSAITLVIVLLVIGFPIVLVFAWAHQLNTDSSAPGKVTTDKLDWALLGALAVVIGIFAYQQIASSRVTTTAPPPGVEVISVAVLPFDNISGDANQAFFSDGMTEEITAALAKIPDLRVVARTSAFQFKAQNRDVLSIGQILHATHYIEGSVRKDGNRLRITAQLIKSDDGTHIWSENYNRELTDVFAIQEDIATSIAAALRMPLGLAPGDSLVRGTLNLGTYQEYLQAKAWFRERNTPRRGPYLQTLESIVAQDPGFAPAWAVLARVYQSQIAGNPAVANGPIGEASSLVQSLGHKAEMAAQRALESDPRHPGGYWAMANIKADAGQWPAAADLFKQGLALDPNDPDLLYNYSLLLLETGHLKQSLSVIEKLRLLEPLIPAYETNAGLIMVVNGQNEAAINVLQAIPQNARSAFVYGWLARALAAKGRYAEAADAMVAAVSLTNPDSKKAVQDAATVLRSAPAKVANQNALPDFGHAEGELLWVYATVGAFDRVMDYAEREIEIGYVTDFGKNLWGPESADLRKAVRFKAFVRRVGLVDYWRATGWPDLCHPTAGDDFACQ